MTHQDAVLDLLKYVGIYGFAPTSSSEEVGGEDDADINMAVASVNFALQEFYRRGPKALKEGHLAAYLNAPTTITLTTVSESIAATGTTQAWMKGCSVLIDGDPGLNKIIEIVGSNVTLLAPYHGASGAHGALVYADAVKLPVNVSTVLDPVEIPGSHRLRPCAGRVDFELMGGNGSVCYLVDMGGYGSGAFYPMLNSNKQTGAPRVWLIEQDRVGGLYLGLNPMPTKASNILYDAYLKPEVVIRADLNETGGADPGVAFTSIPADTVESVLLPIARAHFFQHPSLKNNEMRPTIKEERMDAISTLQTGLGNKVVPVRVRYL